MRSPLLKRRLNPFLLASTVLVLSLLAGVSVLYQGQLSETLDQKKNLSSELEEQKERISELQVENSNLSEQVTQLSSDLTDVKQRNANLENNVNSLKDENEDLTSQVSDLESDVTRLEDLVETLNGSLRIMCTTEQNNLTDGSEFECERRGFEVE